MPRLLVIGAGAAQVDAISRAQDLGVTVIAMDGDPNAPGLKVADVAIVVDINNEREVIAGANAHRVDGVLCFSVEAAVVPVAIAAQALGLPGLSVESARNATSKKRMREIWAAKGIPSCRFMSCRSLDGARAAAEAIGFPLVVKPDDNAGSRGVMYVDTILELESAYRAALVFSRNGDVLVEEFMLGEEMSVEGFLYEGGVHLTGFSDKIRTPPPYLLDLAVLFPSVKAKDVLGEAVQVVSDAAHALGLDMTPIHAELMVTPMGPKMVELAARGPGFKVFSMMIPWSGGVDVVRESIRIALGETPDLGMSAYRGAVLVFPQAMPGKVDSVKGVELARDVPLISDLEVYVKPGDTINPLRSGADRIGHIIALSEERASAVEAVRRAESLLQVDVLS